MQTKGGEISAFFCTMTMTMTMTMTLTSDYDNDQMTLDFVTRDS